MATRKPSSTLVRLTAVERELKGLREDMECNLIGLRDEMLGLRSDVQVLRTDLNDGLGKLLGALERLTDKIDGIAALSPRLDGLEARVARLEARE